MNTESEINSLKIEYITNINQSFPESNRLIIEIQKSRDIKEIDFIYQKYLEIFRIRTRKTFNPFTDEICSLILNSKNKNEVEFINQKFEIFPLMNKYKLKNGSNYINQIRFAKNFEELEDILINLFSSCRNKSIDLKKLLKIYWDKYEIDKLFKICYE